MAGNYDYGLVITTLDHQIHYIPYHTILSNTILYEYSCGLVVTTLDLQVSSKPLESREGEPSLPTSPDKAEGPVIVRNRPYWVALAPLPLALMACIAKGSRELRRKDSKATYKAAQARHRWGALWSLFVGVVRKPRGSL